MATPPNGYVSVANLEVTTVRPHPEGFRLQGAGADGADYVMDMHIDMPIDQRTRSVLGEILSQSEWRVFRRARQPLKLRARRKRVPEAAKPK
jgi:hypothetical protein